MSLQPAEFAKLAAVLVLSCAVACLPRFRATLQASGDGRGALVLVFIEPDFGTSVVLLAGAA